MNEDRPLDGDVRAPAHLEASQEALDCLLNTTTSGFWYLDVAGNILAVNPSYCLLSGYSEDELLQMHISDLDAREGPEDSARHMADLIEKGFLLFETRHRRKDGTIWDAEVSCSYLPGRGEGQVFAFFRDITRTRQAGQELARQLDFNQRVFNATDAHLAVVGPDGVILSVNDSWAVFARENLGQDESTWGEGARYFRNCSEEYGDMTSAREAFDGVRRVQSGELDRFSLEYPCHGPDGQKRWFVLQVFPLAGARGSVLVSHQNITERKLAEEALHKSERLLSASQELAGVGGWEYDVPGGAMFWTDETYRIHGLAPGGLDLTDPDNRNRIHACYAPEDRPTIQAAFQDCMEKARGYDLEFPYTAFDGRQIWVRATAKPVMEAGQVVKIFGTFMDITERRQAEQELLKMEKLESLGVLAGGIAHDFNNILTGIMGNLSMLRMYLDRHHPAFKALVDAETATARAESLAFQLLTFARGGEPIKEELAVGRLAEEAVSLSLRGSSVKGLVEIPPTIHGVEADAGQLSQAFHNIIINAKQAMPSGGELRVTAANETVAEPGVHGLAPGHYVRLEFADNGPGINRDDLKRIFDPYYTTKQKGNGLGLASVYSIVNRHGGRVEVESKPGEGATFVLFLPATGRTAPARRDEGAAVVGGDSAFQGRLLVMDDEEIILELAEAMLNYLGFEVTLCHDGAAAVHLFDQARKQGQPYRAVIMDLTVPGGMGGRDAAQEILKLDPAARLVVSSGYSNDPVLADFHKYGFQGAVAKPYNIVQMEKVLCQMLREDKPD